MVRTLICISWVILAAVSQAPDANAQVKTAYQLLPDSTQAVVWISDTGELTDRWDRTQLANWH